MVRSTLRDQPDPVIFDVEHLRRYTLGNEELEAELLSLFEAQVAALMSAIESAANQAEWRRAVHTLKGSAHTLGAVAVGDLALRLEEIGPSAPPQAREPLLSQLAEAIADFLEEAGKLAPAA